MTDDSVMTIAVAKALLNCSQTGKPFGHKLIEEMQDMGHRYPNAGYGKKFKGWLEAQNPSPYGSYGNGSAMRVSPCALFAVTLEETLELAKASAEVTHNHPEGIKGAQAIAACIFLAKEGKSKEEIKNYIEKHFYALNISLDTIRPGYSFDVSCQGSVPQAIQAFLESSDYEDAIRNAISIGGDSDTIAAMTGSIAWTYYRLLEKNKRAGGIERTKIFETLSGQADKYLPADIIKLIARFDELWMSRYESYIEDGKVSKIDISGAEETPGKTHSDNRLSMAMIKSYFRSKNFPYKETIKGKELSLGVSKYRLPNNSTFDMKLMLGDNDHLLSVRTYNICSFPENRIADVYRTCSLINSKSSWVSFYVDERNHTICSDFDAIIIPEAAGFLAFELVLRIIKSIDAAYTALCFE